MKKKITLMLFAVFCTFGISHTLKAQTTPIDELVERLEQVGEHHASINNFFTQEELVRLRSHFSANRDFVTLSNKDRERGSGIAAYCVINTSNEFGSFDPTNGITVNVIGPSAIVGTEDEFENAGSVNPADSSTAWVLASNGDAYTVDVDTGTYTLVGTIPGEWNWSAAEFDHSTGLFYALTFNFDLGTADLYQVDVPSLTATLVGPLGLGVPFALAIDGDGNGYTYDIIDDNLYSVNLSSGATSLIGPIGFDAAFGQGMFWNSATDTVLMTAFNNTPGVIDSELRSVNTTTGATTLINQMQPEALTQYAWSSAPATTPPPPPPPCTVFEDFEEGLPEGWSTVVNAGDCDWAIQAETPTGDDFTSLAVVFDDDACGSGAPASNVSLLSDVYDTSGANSILIGYDVAFQEVGAGETLTVEVWDGAEWQQIALYDTDLDPDIQTEVDIDASAFANADFQVRWTYDDGGGAWSWHAGVDNFCMDLGFPDPANVQVIHNSPDPAAEVVDVYINDVLALDDVEFRTATPFLELPSGVSLSIDIAGASSGELGDPLNPDDSLFNLTTTLDEGENYLLVANGVLDPGAFATDNAFDLTVYAGARTVADDPALVDVLVHHGSPDAPPVDVNETGAGTIVSNIAYPEFQGYLSLPIENYVLEIAAAGSPDALVSYQAPLAALGGFDGTAVTVIASGFFGEDAGDTNGFGLWVASAAGGPLLELPLLPDAPEECTVFEGFESGLPTGWSTVVNTGDCDWVNQAETPVGDDFPTLAMLFDDDACGSLAPASNVSILSDVYDTTGATSILIGYDVTFRGVNAGESLTVEVWDGTEWQQIAVYEDTLEPNIQTEAGLDATAFANADFQVRWTYDDAGAWGWFAGIDNFCMKLNFSAFANVQVIHNSPDPAAELVDVYINDVLELNDVAFRTATPFLQLPSGVPVSIDVAGATSGDLGDPLNPDDSLFNLTTTLDEGENYILVANGVLDPGAFATDNAFDLTVYAGARTVADDSSLVDVLVHHGSPDAPAVDVNEPGAGNLVSNIAYPEFQGYLSLPVENYVLEIAAAGSPDALLAYQAPLAALGGFEGAAITVIASGFFGEDAGDSNGFGLWVASATGGPLLELPLLPEPPEECTVFVGFESGLPTGWSTVVNTGDCDWVNQAETPIGDDFPTLAMVFDDDACGSGAPASNVSLLSDVYDTSGATSILISYDVAFQEVGSGDSLTVEVWDGAEWQQIAFYDADLDPNIQTEQDLDATAFANADFQVRWTYDDAGAWAWHAGVDSFCMKLNTLGTADNEIAGFEYYPNPANNSLNLSARTNIDSVIIYNILGQKVIDQNVDSMSTTLDVSTLSSGTYIMRVTAGGQVASYKIVKR